MARALLERPKVLVLDEATASVDGETDAQIQRTLRELPQLRDATVLSVAHRLATIIDFGRVLVMDRGRAAEAGAPAELLDAGGSSPRSSTRPGSRAAARARRARGGGARGRAGPRGPAARERARGAALQMLVRCGF